MAKKVTKKDCLSQGGNWILEKKRRKHAKDRHVRYQHENDDSDEIPENTRAKLQDNMHVVINWFQAGMDSPSDRAEMQKLLDEASRLIE